MLARFSPGRTAVPLLALLVCACVGHATGAPGMAGDAGSNDSARVSLDGGALDGNGIVDAADAPLPDTGSPPMDAESLPADGGAPSTDAGSSEAGSDPRALLQARGHHFERAGRPFFWLADDGWALLNRASLRHRVGVRNEVEHYLDTRRAQGFTVIHTWLTASWMTENEEGEAPFLSRLDNNRRIEPNAAFFSHVARVLDMAAARDLYVVIEVGQVLRQSPSNLYLGGFDTDGRSGISEADHAAHQRKAYRYGWHVARSLMEGERARWNLIWGLGQDTHPERGNRVGPHNAANGGAWYVDLVQAVAEGIADATNGLAIESHDERADYGTTFMSFHVGASGPVGGASGDPSSSAEWFHDDPWLDYNSNQSGRHNRFIEETVELMTANYLETPTKPAVEAEVGYEGSLPIAGGRHFSAYDMRVHGYWSILAGGAGYQYGHLSVWQLYDERRAPRASANQHWLESIQAVGATHMVHLRRLVQSRPMEQLHPLPDVLVGGRGGAPHTWLMAAGDPAGSYAFVYTTNGRDVAVDLSTLAGDHAIAWWYDPRTGEADPIGTFDSRGHRTFDPPGAPTGSDTSTGNDWVLVLDASDPGFGPPGTL